MVNWILGDLFTQDYGHCNSIQQLWEKRWQAPCKRSTYPFHDGAYEDFASIFERLIAQNINDPYLDAYTNAFIPTAEALAKKARSLENNDRDKAVELYKRAGVVLRIARFPYIATELKKRCFELQKEVYMRGAKLWEVPMREEVINHKYAANGDNSKIPLYLRVPPAASKKNPCPVILFITGLDGHRPDFTEVNPTNF